MKRRFPRSLEQATTDDIFRLSPKQLMRLAVKDRRRQERREEREMEKLEREQERLCQ